MFIATINYVAHVIYETTDPKIKFQDSFKFAKFISNSRIFLDLEFR